MKTPSTLSAFACVLMISLISGCKSYRRAPLDPLQVVTKVDQMRREPDAASNAPDSTANSDQAAETAPAFTLTQASAWLRKHGPDVREALAEYRTTLAVAKIKTPLPNPGLEIGPQFGFGPDLGPVNRVTPFGSIGFTIPLGKRLRRQNELNKALAEVARVNARAHFRELYLTLRGQYSAFVVAGRRTEARKNISEAAKKSLEAGKRLVAAGQGTALDVAMFDLEYQRSLIDIMSAEREAALSAAALAILIGVHSDLFKGAKEEFLPELPNKLPARKALTGLLVTHHSGLARLRAAYEASERSLRLNISKQFPDFHFGPSFDSEIGEKKTVVGLTLGIELPFFDRNQQGIAEAEKQREAMRVQYEAEANRALSALDRTYLELQLAMKARQLLADKVLPKALQTVNLARRSLEAGVADALRLLDAERTVRQMQIEALNAELDERSAWIELEKSVGFPILKFPLKADEKPDAPPSELEASVEEVLNSKSSSKKTRPNSEDQTQ